MAEDKGRCINCGFFGKRSLGEQVPAVIEVTYKERDKINLEPVAGRSCRAVCYRNKAQFDFTPPSHDFEKLKEQMHQKRECKSWYPYEEGRSPEKHFEELKMFELEQRREEFEQKMEADRQAFELKMENDRKEFDIKLQQNSDEITSRADIFNRRVTIFFIILAVLEVLGSLAALAFPNGIKWLVDLFS